ncbi:metallophosphoesterase [Glaciihabitans sp. dw_435]|uniref:metallophosphoesterase family protein n=1 Tax=Glaciihabitans sp. dw_435 TaxID=2720081 RepID=UPI001BD20DE9|nr:metallophosphoesterase [Glaciihabitans sp. dw_435]
MLTIAHLSDPHLDLSPERTRRLAAVLRQVDTLPRVDALLVSGDLADHGLAEEYAEFFAELPSEIPWLVTAGNHDLTGPLTDALSAAGMTPSSNAVLHLDGLSIIGLDSHTDGRDDGLLNTTAVDFAREHIRAAPGPVVVMLHHPPVPIGHHIVDEHFALTNPDDLESLIRENPNVIAVFTGHVHAAFTTTFAGVPVLGSPGIVSTMRLGSRADPIANFDAMPGFALHTIDGQNIRTVFHYLHPKDL